MGLCFSGPCAAFVGKSAPQAPRTRQGRTADGVRAALEVYFDAQHSSSAEKLAQVWHPQGEMLMTMADGTLAVLDSAKIRDRVAKRAPSTSEDFVRHDAILALQLLDDRTAAARVQVALQVAEPMLFTDFLTLLRDDAAGGWRIISKVSSCKPLAEALLESRRPLPADFAAVADAAWSGYVAPNHADDAERMRQVFHPLARLSFFAGPNLQVVPGEAFCALIGDKWSHPMFAGYQHLRDDPRSQAADTLLGIEFAGPDLALVTLRIGLPPFLFTDVLSLARLADDKWWIVAKSSIGVPYLANEKMD